MCCYVVEVVVVDAVPRPGELLLFMVVGCHPAITTIHSCCGVVVLVVVGGYTQRTTHSTRSGCVQPPRSCYRRGVV